MSDTIDALQAVNEFREHIPSFVSTKERDREFLKLQEQLNVLGFASVEDLFNQVDANKLDLLPYVDDSFKGRSLRVVLMNDYRTGLLVKLRQDDVIPDTIYLCTPNEKVILTTPETYQKIDRQYCRDNEISLSDCMIYSTHIITRGVLVMSGLFKFQFNPQYWQHLLWDVLNNSGVLATKEHNDLHVQGKKVFGCRNSIDLVKRLTGKNEVTWLHGILSYAFSPEDKELFTRAFTDQTAAAAVMEQIGSASIPNINDLLARFKESFVRVFRQSIVFENISSPEISTLSTNEVTL
jgi:hypothetical protein